MTISGFEEKIYAGQPITKEDALFLSMAPQEELCGAANRIRMRFCGNSFDLCTIINGKSGRCPEDCKYCAQSTHYGAKIEEYPLLEEAIIAERAAESAKRGALRYSIVTSGRTLSEEEISVLCHVSNRIKETCQIEVCVSGGLLQEAQYRRLKQAGVTRIHNNLESSERFFPHICTTHTINDKIKSIRAAQAAGMQVCSGGIIGIGESMEDRIDLALLLRSLNIRSVPVNILNPIPKTPLAHQPMLNMDEICRTIALFRFILPKAAIRLAGGRKMLADGGRACLLSGANAAISGDLLTTSGNTLENDRKMIAECGFRPALLDE